MYLDALFSKKPIHEYLKYIQIWYGTENIDSIYFYDRRR